MINGWCSAGGGVMYVRVRVPACALRDPSMPVVCQWSWGYASGHSPHCLLRNEHSTRPSPAIHRDMAQFTCTLQPYGMRCHTIEGMSSICITS
jgi:hypothetical protein